ncbi:carbohydrate ABC transporter permease [Litorilinea aerophila]|uniref:carbohydrate ABC transporter permease n=1 Tax=Litorilinea aerophila TaxID=1204385 RepID=UPI001E5B9503|nr:carbohydrate ABC transporter permease [Litorilinea aerophila]MCC9079019.1 carbohydrate ABC transporter permease [Litorilinea aerophila]
MPYHRTLKLAARIALNMGVYAGALLFIVPFYWMVTTSVKTSAQLFVFPPALIPNPVELHHYAQALETVPLARYFANTVYLTGLNLAGTLISCTLVAFAFARYEVPGSRLWFGLLLATMMLPYHVTMIPLFVAYSKVGWTNTFRPLWIEAFFGNAFYIFLLRQFFRTIPNELFDAGKIDGCSEFDLYQRIMLPLAKPALITVTIFQFQHTWNEFLRPLIYINKQSMKPLSLGLQDFYAAYSVEWQQLMAASTLMVLPVVLLFFFLQRYFIEGIALTGLKG